MCGLTYIGFSSSVCSVGEIWVEIMSGKVDNKSVVMSDVVPVMSKITEHKLNGSNYLDWSKTVRLYLRSIDKDDHLTEDPPTDDSSKQTWLREDARLFLQIRNSIDNEVVGLINHCEFVKELMEYLDFLYSRKGNVSRIYEVYKAFIVQRNRIGL